MVAVRLALLAIASATLLACGASSSGSAIGEPSGSTAASIARGEVLLEQGEYAEAAALFESVIVDEPSNAKGHYYLGLSRENLGDAQAAIEQYRLAIGHDPSLSEAHNNLGNLLLMSGEISEAEAELSTYLQQRPDEAAAHYNYGLVLEELGKTNEAHKHYQQAADLDPEDPAPVIGLADVAWAAGDLERALGLYRKARELDPGDPLPVLQEGQALIELQQKAEAKAVLLGLTDIPRADARLLTTAGILLSRIDDPTGALALYQAAVERDDTYALAHFKLANALGRRDQFAQAAVHFERFLELAPDAPEAAMARHGLADCRKKANN